MNLYGRVIRHKNNMDVCYYITKSNDIKGLMILKAEIVNMNYVKSILLNIKCKIKIKSEERKDWLICAKMEVPCLRYTEWRALR